VTWWVECEGCLYEWEVRLPFDVAPEDAAERCPECDGAALRFEVGSDA
jgi:hypothetical protein